MEKMMTTRMPSYKDGDEDGDDVVIGDHCYLHSHCVIRANTTLKEHVTAESFCVIGGNPGIVGFDRSIKSGVLIGAR